MAVERGWWDQGVKVVLRGDAAHTIVSNTHQAGRILLEDWPADPGPKHLQARRAVLRAMEKALDRRRQADARDAFAEAAKEAGIALE